MPNIKTQSKLQHIGTLIGRTFLIAQSEVWKFWNGSDYENDSDYEELGDYLIYEEGELLQYLKDGFKYYAMVSMSQKIEIFKVYNGIVITEGLYFNEKLKKSDYLIFEEKEQFPFNILVTDDLIIADATMNGNEISNGLNQRESKNTDSYFSIPIEPGNYKVTRITATGEDIELQGFELTAINL